MDLAQLARDYDRDGFVIARAVFSRGEVATLEEQLAAFIRDVAPKLGLGDVYYEDSPARPIKSMFRLDQHRECFRALKADPRLLALMRAIFPSQGEVIPEVVMYFGKPARDGSVTPQHQDNAFQNWDPAHALTATIAIDESTAENGALTCYRGTHRLGLLPHRQSGVLGFSRCLITPVEASRHEAVRLCMQPGDVALHHVNCVHGSGANATDRPRRQLGVGYRSSLARRDEAAFAEYQRLANELHKAGTGGAGLRASGA